MSRSPNQDRDWRFTRRNPSAGQDSEERLQRRAINWIETEVAATMRPGPSRSCNVIGVRRVA